MIEGHRFVRAIVRFFFAYAVLLAAATGLAVDGYVVTTNGSVKLIFSHPSIRLISELVRIAVPDGTISADFVFKNVGPEVTVQMGIPEPEGSKASAPRISGYRTYVDGVAFVAKRIAEQNAKGETVRFWWVKTVKFGRAQKRTIRTEFVATPDATSEMQRSITFDLHPASSWRGPVELIQVYADISGLTAYTFKEAHPALTVQSGSRLVWLFQKLDPSPDQSITVSWFEGFLNIFMNGRRIHAQDSWIRYGAISKPVDMMVPLSFGLPPSLRLREVEISAQAAAHYLGLTATYNPATKSCVFRKPDGKWLWLRAGKGVARIGSAIVPLPFKPFLAEGRFRIPFCVLARAMGATVTFPKSREVQVTADWLR